MSTVISAGDPGFELRELRRYAGLLRYLSLRDVFVRYKQTWMGFAWSVIRPLVNIAIFGTVYDEDDVATFDISVDDMRSDETGNTCDQSYHVSPSFRVE